MKLQLKRSSTLDGGFAKAPTIGQLEYGELAVNFNEGDPTIFIKDSSDAIIRIAGAGAEWIPSSPGDIGADLQGVTDVGNNTTNDITLNTDKIVLSATGSGEFAGTVQVGDDNPDRIKLFANGLISVRRDDGDILNVYKGGLNADNRNVVINSSGSATFEGKVDVNNELHVYRASTTASNALLALHSDIGGADTRKATVRADGSATFDGDVTAAKFIGDGSELTGLSVPIQGIIPPVISYENADWSAGGRLSVETKGFCPGQNTTSTCQWMRDYVDIPGATSCLAWTQTSTTGAYQLKVLWTDTDTGQTGIAISNVIDVGGTPEISLQDLLPKDFSTLPLLP